MPYGGRVQNGRLRLPNGQSIDYPQPDGGNTWVVRHPAAPGAARTAEQAADDAARGFVWRDHAIIAGRTKMVYGQPLGAIGNRNWLYCDAAGCTWVVGAYIYRPGDKPTHLRIDVWLYKRFGFFGSGEAPAIDRLLATRDLIPTWDDQVESVWGGTLTPPQSIFGYQGASNAVQPIPNEDGSRTLVCVMGDGGDNSQDLFLDVNGSWRFLSDVFEVKLSGAGTSLRDVAGAGISAAIAHTHTASDLIEQADIDTRPPDDALKDFHYEEAPCTGDPATATGQWLCHPKNGERITRTRLKLLPFWRDGQIAWVETLRVSGDARSVSVSCSGTRVWSCVNGNTFAVLSDTTSVSFSCVFNTYSERSTYVDGAAHGGYVSNTVATANGTANGMTAIGEARDYIPYLTPSQPQGAYIWPDRGLPKMVTNNLVQFGRLLGGDPELYTYHLVSLGESSQTRVFDNLEALPAGLTAHPETGEIAFGCWV